MTSAAFALVAGPGWALGHTGAQIKRFDSIIEAYHPDDVLPALNTLGNQLSMNKIAIGYLAYEAAAGFGLPVNRPDGQPLLWFGVANKEALHPFDEWPSEFDAECSFELNHIADEGHSESIKQIKDYIAAGDTYQVNLTERALVDLSGSPRALFKQLVQSQPCPYAAYIDTGKQTVLSLSPELFLQRKGAQITGRPMKGTIARGRTLEEDQALRTQLEQSEKERAEHIMIVDMVRNDLGRVCQYGSLSLTKPYQTEAYRTLWQMTSEISGSVLPEFSLQHILLATFPPASITGAPKHRTMDIIKKLEPTPRGVYCGSIGLFHGEDDFVMNVAIRTLVGSNNKYTLGLGGGIVWDSNPSAERNELDIKAKFISCPLPEFELLETIGFTRKHGYSFLHEHMQRLAASAAYWQVLFCQSTIESALLEYANQIGLDQAAVRLTVNQSGKISITHRAITPLPDQVTARFSHHTVNSNDRFYFHKTTHRPLYNQERTAATEEGLFEILFVNEHGRVTEGTITNLFYRMGGEWFTPPVSEGLLPGVWRDHFVMIKNAAERTIHIEELLKCDEVRLGNSVIGDAVVDAILYDKTINERK